MTTCTVTVTLHSGAREALHGVDEGDAVQARIRFSDWAGLGGERNNRDEWPDSAVLDLISEVHAVSMVVPYSAIAILKVTPETHR